MIRALEPPYVSWLIGLALLPFLVVVGRISRRWTSGPAGLATFLRGAWSPWIAGAVTFVIVRIVWGSLARTRHRARRARVSAAGCDLRARTLDGAVATHSGVLRADARVRRAGRLCQVPAGARADARARHLVRTAGTDAGAADRIGGSLNLLARPTRVERLDRSADVVSLDDVTCGAYLGDHVLFGEHEPGDVARSRVRDAPLA